MEISQDPSSITLKEYGKNIQNIVNFIMSVDDREKRTRLAHTCIELMRQLNPNMRDAQDQYNRLWDHLYIMSDFKLDVDSPYPMPEEEAIGKKPMRVEYPNSRLRFKHYGHNIELMIKKAIAVEDAEEREASIIYLGKLMKRFYAAWNKDNIDDEVILDHLLLLSNGKLSLPIERIKAEGLFDSKEIGGGNNNKREFSLGNDGGERSERGERRDRNNGGHKHKNKNGNNNNKRRRI